MSLPVTEDTPPDMLAGSMDLNVVLPNGKHVKMSIQRSTPMMDLLVQVTTAHRLSPGSHALQAMGDGGVLPYKPSTPIGTLDAFTIKIVEKKLSTHKKAPQVPQAFLNTFRLQVNLPRSQLFVTRVTPDVALAEILTHICTEKNLDSNKYEFRNPGNSEEVLELDKTLGYYKVQELSLVNKNNRTVGGLLSSADILHVKSSKHRQNSVCDSSLSSGSLGSRSTSPVPVNLPRVPPQPPIRKKRRPAPKPPQCAKDEGKEETKTSRSALISHSRESSDSSGYHEASVLSESPTHNVPLGRSEGGSPPDTLPRHSKLLPSQSFTNLTVIQPPSGARLASSASNASLNSNGTSRKKRPPPPPPPVSVQAKAEEKMKSSTLPTSRAEERIVSNVPFVSAENGEELSDAEYPTVKSANTKVENVETAVESEPKLIPQTKVDVEVDKSEAKSVVEVPGETSPAGDVELNGHDHNDDDDDDDSLNWQYQLPPPPTDFRDSNSPNCTEFGTVTITPDIYKEDGVCGKEADEADLPGEGEKAYSKDCKRKTRAARREESAPAAKESDDARLSQRKSAVMGELTNVLTDGWKAKEKSSSVSNLCARDSFRSGREIQGLSYSKSFSSELPTHVKSVSAPPRETSGRENNRNDKRENNIKYKNHRNKMEKSLSMECIRARLQDECEHKADEAFRRPAAPVQKKLKTAKRSASTMAANAATAKRKSDSDVDFDADADNIAILRQHFLEFLKEKNLNNDLSMKSLNVIRHILPKINGQVEGEKPANGVGSDEAERGKVQKAGSVKVIDVKKKGSALMNRDVKENVVIIEERDSGSEARKEAEAEGEEKAGREPRRIEPAKRFSYHAPPSINFATWGERPKTQVFIKDEDYVTEEKVTKKMERKPVEEAQKPVAVKKPGILQFKKPGVISRYEMFSALPRKKEVTSLSLVQMEDEERRKKKMEEARDASRMPVVCGVELKKEFRERQGGQPLSITEVTIKPEAKPTHSVSIYINGSQRSDPGSKTTAIAEAARPAPSAFAPQKRSCTVMPVVKGFRTVNESGFHSHVNINKICNIGGGGGNGAHDPGPIANPKLRHVPRVMLSGAPPPPPPPPPPPAGFVSLKPASARQLKPKPESRDQRDQLMRDIRNFAGFGSRKLKTAQ